VRVVVTLQDFLNFFGTLSKGLHAEKVFAIKIIGGSIFLRLISPNSAIEEGLRQFDRIKKLDNPKP